MRARPTEMWSRALALPSFVHGVGAGNAVNHGQSFGRLKPVATALLVWLFAMNGFAEDHSASIIKRVQALTDLARSGKISESVADLDQVEKDLLPTDTPLARVAVLEARITALQREPEAWGRIQTLLDAAERMAEASTSAELQALVLLTHAHTANVMQRYDEALNALSRLRRLPGLPLRERLSAHVAEAVTQHYIGQLEASKLASEKGIAEAKDYPLVQAQMRSHLALTLMRMDDNDEALRHANSAIRALSDHTEDRACAEALASAHLTRAILRGSTPDAARTDYLRAVQLWEQLYGRESPSLIPALTSLGYGLLVTSDLEEAERVLQRGLDLAQRNRLIPYDQLTLLENLTLLRIKQGRADEAKALAARMRDIWADWVPLVLEAGSEAERLNLLLQSHWIDAAIAAGDEAKAIEAILANYGSLFDSLLRDAALAARLPRDQRQDYKQSQAKLAALALHGDASDEAEEVSRLRRLIQSMSAPIARVFDAADGAAFRAALPEDGALVVFASYRSLDLKPMRRLAVAVLTRDAQQLILLPATCDAVRNVGDDLIKALQPVAREDQTAKAERAALAQQHLHDLREALSTPLKAALGSTRQLFLCLDGCMNRVPATLWNDHRVTFLTSPRALLRKAPTQGGMNAAWMMVNAGHEALRFPAGQPFPYSIANEYDDHTLRALRGADEEARALVEAHPDRWQLLRSQLDDGTTAEPSESAFTQILAEPPAILHFAGHAAHRDIEVSAAQASPWWQGLEQPNALWTSCLYFPQPYPATNPEDVSNDNYLFAAEIAGLDLSGTQLVTLSACETGSGLSPLSEGSYSLARAFHTAGVRDVLSCTEPLPDAAVAELMKPFYDRIAKGDDAAQAFWEEQQRAIGDDLKQLRAFGFFRLTRAWR